MASEFRFAPYSAMVDPGPLPVTAVPLIEAAPTVVYPATTHTKPDGHASGRWGLPWCRIGRRQIELAGIDFYETLFAGKPSIAVKVRLWDKHSRTWKLYCGVAHEPLYGPPVRGDYMFSDFVILITQLTPITAWSDMPWGTP